jgi:hypothetical protein
MNEWLDAYVHGAWPERVKIKDRLVEALQLLIARRGGPRQERLETEFLTAEMPAGNSSARKVP